MYQRCPGRRGPSLEGVARGAAALWLAVALAPAPAQSCMETAWRRGHLGREALIEVVSVADAVTGSCTCCAICHRTTNCSSFGFNSATAACELYNSVASYATLLPDRKENWSYFVMPGRSAHEQFCRQDSDCTEEGDACRGRVCTNRTSVTCRVICEEFGAGRRFGGDVPRMYGWLNGQTLMLTCWMNWRTQGYTELLYSTKGFKFNNQTILDSTAHWTILDFNRALDAEKPRSILGLAEDLRKSNNESSDYSIEVWIELYLPQSGPTLLSINFDPTQTQLSWGVLARTDGEIAYDFITVYIRE
ncbi:hypothetical protein FJT64_015416 [Amphibalanus amphitrite]|uniref:Apple domain-containing protein n=1 Tax=Amphibalanus amphitrite TaxID=1232801 RepID=A0A6A4X4G8_AMPAM|nr:hypothetical protein FJT64_015416 [Amphibalanus amphitrite]